MYFKIAIIDTFNSKIVIEMLNKRLRPIFSKYKLIKGNVVYEKNFICMNKESDK